MPTCSPARDKLAFKFILHDAAEATASKDASTARLFFLLGQWLCCLLQWAARNAYRRRSRVSRLHNRYTQDGVAELRRWPWQRSCGWSGTLRCCTIEQFDRLHKFHVLTMTCRQHTPLLKSARLLTKYIQGSFPAFHLCELQSVCSGS